MVKRPIQLSIDLECAILSACLRGLIDRASLDPAEFSKPGRLVISAISSIANSGGMAPYDPTSVLLTATDVLGADKAVVQAHLRGIQAVEGSTDVGDILRKVHDKQLLVEFINEAGTQLQRGSVDLGSLSSLLQRDRAVSGDGCRPISDRIKDGLPEPPTGLLLGSLKKLTAATGGVYGIWAIAGEPGVGKSTLAWQISLDLGRNTSVVYYDFENGFSVLMDHTRILYGGKLDAIRTATSRVFHRDSIRTLDSDLAFVAPPAIVVVDSVQKLPASMEYRRASLDKWIHRLESLKKRGYHVLLVSEVSRAQYGNDAYIGSFKETGEIEYSADVGLQLTPGAGETIEVHIVKNRHRPHKGFLGHIARYNSWMFKEVEAQEEEM